MSHVLPGTAGDETGRWDHAFLAFPRRKTATELATTSIRTVSAENSEGFIFPSFVT